MSFVITVENESTFKFFFIYFDTNFIAEIVLFSFNFKNSLSIDLFKEFSNGSSTLPYQRALIFILSDSPDVYLPRKNN